MTAPMPSPLRRLTRRPTTTRDVPDTVTWTARCPHGKDGDWRAERAEVEMGDAKVRIVCLCRCEGAT